MMAASFVQLDHRTMLVLEADAPLIVRNAARLLQEEWQAHMGGPLSECAQAQGASLVLECGEDENAESFVLSWDAAAHRLTVYGRGPRGVLYGIDELLDRICWNKEGATLDLSGYKGQPDAILRSIGGPDLACSPAEMTRVLKLLARLRYNQMSPKWVRWAQSSYANMPELGIPVSADTVRQQEIINRLIEEAAGWGIRISLGMRLIDFPHEFLAVYPEAVGEGASLCPLAPETLLLVRRQAEDLVAQYPGLAGVHILGSEAESDVFACHCPRCRDKSTSERFGTLLGVMAEALGERAIYFMTYLSGWRNIKEPKYYHDLAKYVPPTVKIQVNAMWSDQFITHPPHPLIGAYPGEDTLIDFDLWGEYWGWGDIPCCLADYLRERMDYCYERGITNYWGRVSWAFFDSLYNGTLNEVNYYLFARLLWDRQIDPRGVVRAWAAQRFGEAAADNITELMYFSWDIVTHMMYTDGLLTNSHSHPPESLVRMRYLMRDFSAPFFPDGIERCKVTPEHVRGWMAEKQRLLEECQRAAELAQGLAECMEPQQHRELYATFYDTWQTAKVWYYLYRAVWTHELLCREESELVRPRMAAEVLAAIEECERACWRAKRCDPGYAFGILNELRIALKRPVPPWGGYVPTGRSEERAQSGKASAEPGV